MQIITKRKALAVDKIGLCLLIFITFLFSTGKIMAFEFDGFQSGLTLNQVLVIAQQRDLGIYDGQKNAIPSGHFKAELFKETSKIIILTYHTDLLGERVSVDLHFTPQTKRLFFAKINLKASLKYMAGLTSVLDKKYGAHKNSYGLLFTMQKSTDWNVDERTEIKIVKYMTLYSLQYTDPSLLKLNKKEKAKTALSEKEDLKKLNDNKL